MTFGVARRFREAADTVAQRLKAIEYVAVRNGKWEHAQFMELITPENRGNMATPADLGTIVAERKAAVKLTPEPHSVGFRKGQGRGPH